MSRETKFPKLVGKKIKSAVARIDECSDGMLLPTLELEFSDGTMWSMQLRSTPDWVAQFFPDDQHCDKEIRVKS